MHYDLPVTGNELDKTTYIHRAGRCARFTNKGVSLAFEVESHPSTTQLLDKLEADFQAEAAADGEPAAGLSFWRFQSSRRWGMLGQSPKITTPTPAKAPSPSL